MRIIQEEKIHLEAFERRSLIGSRPDQIMVRLDSINEPGYRSHQIYHWIHHKNSFSFEEMTDIPSSLRIHLKNHFYLKTLQLAEHKLASDGTEKFLWKLYDGRYIESVLIPESNRTTICISSQVGCSLRCSFCATGTMGFIRNLTAGEIIEQVLQIKKITNHSITNVVFMGMGEPLLNYSRVIQACQILGDPKGVALRNKRITLSTSGIVPKIYQFSKDNLPYSLAISLHAPEQELREQIMPVASKFGLEQLLESVKYYMNARKRNWVTFEYILLHGINDSPDQMRRLIRLLAPFRCKLNVIPCNQNYLGYSAPDQKHIEDLASVLMKAPFPVTFRKNRGEDIMAACGQLAVKVEEKVIFMKNN